MTDFEGESYGLAVPASDFEDIFNWFHLSLQDLGTTFTFTPRIPKSPLAAEDNFTPRISLAPTIRNAESAIGKGNYIVYAGDIKQNSSDNISVLDVSKKQPTCSKNLSTPNVKYDYNYHMENFFNALYNGDLKLKLTDSETKAIDYLKNQHSRLYHITPAQLPKRIRSLFYACVPDANETGEVWSLKPITLKKIGYFTGGNTVNPTNLGIKILQNHGKKLPFMSITEFFGFLKKKETSSPWEAVNKVRKELAKLLPQVPYDIAKNLRYVSEKASIEELQSKYHLETPEQALKFFQDILLNAKRLIASSRKLKERNESDALYRNLPGMVLDPNYNLKNTEPDQPAPEEFGSFDSPAGMGRIVAPKRFIPRE